MSGNASDLDGAAQSSEPSQTLVQALLERVTRLEDERAIIDVLHRYGQAADDGEDRVWADLFTENGVFLGLDRAANVILREEGRPELARWLREFRARETLITKHVVLAPVVAVEGERAVVKSYLVRISENEDPGASPYLLHMGRYRDEMVKCPDGRWRFQQRTAHVDAPWRGPIPE